MSNIPAHWFKIADYDFETAKAMLQARRKLYVGFMCHQTIEKCLKGYFVHQFSKEPPYLHKLTRLADLCGIREVLTEEQKSLMFRLDPLNIASRYPAYKQGILKTLSFKDCTNLIKETNSFRKWIKKQLKK